MRIVLRLLMVFVIANGLNVAHAEGAEWADEYGVGWPEEYDAGDIAGAVKMEDMPHPTAGALDSLPDPALDSASVEAADSLDEPSIEPGEEEELTPTVELYITSWCGYCRQAREFLHARGIPFVEYDIERDANAARRKQALNGGPGVPVAVINGQVVVGFSHSIYEDALRTVQ